MEVYIDGVLVKSEKASSGKILGFMVTQRGIEANPIQLKTIMDSQVPTSRKGVQRLTGQLEALGRFISHFIDRFISHFTNLLRPFFIILRGAKTAVRNEECYQNFMTIKQYLTEPPILASPEVGDTLYLYLAVS